jgi:N-acetyl-anhydromuramyl-L-alanine amidase AmpD
MPSGITSLITQAQLPDDQYINEVVDKDQIFVHHTASSGNPFGVMEYWAGSAERVSTAFLIARGSGKTRSGQTWKDGEIVQCFSSAKWGWHLGLKKHHLVRGGRSSTDMNKKSVGIEICNWGNLTKKADGKFHTYASSTRYPSIVPAEQVQTYDTPYRGSRYYQKYTDPQLENTRKLIQYLCDRYEIDKTFKGMEIFNIDRRCLMGENGIWTHTSCRPDKFDCHPQPELIQMLRSI